MRALAYACLLPAWALFAGCVGPPRDEDWLALGFRSPEQTFRTFQTGLRADLPDLEYRCLGADFKRRSGGISLLAYAEFRRELFRENRWLEYAAWARIRSVRELAPGRVRIEAEVDTWFYDASFDVDLVREDFYELWVGDRRVDDGLARWERLAEERDGKLLVEVPLPAGLALPGIGELRAGREWKIDGFPLAQDPSGSSP
jgi:hypothetical protein